MYDVFISYRRDGGSDAARIIQLQLKDLGYKVFLDYDELTDGVFDEKIISALSNSKLFMFVLSEGSLERCKNEDDWVRKEIMYAINHNMHIIPVIPNAKLTVIPKDIPQPIIDAISRNQHSEIRLGQSLKYDIQMLVDNRIAPYVGKQSVFKKHTKSIISIIVVAVVIVICGIYMVNLQNDVSSFMSDVKIKDSINQIETKSEAQPQVQSQPQTVVKYTEVGYEKVGNYKDGFAKIRTKTGYGFINRNDEVVVEPIYDKAEDFCNGFAEVKKNGKWGFVNSQGYLAIDCKFDDVFNFHEGMAIIKEGNKCGFIDETGTIVIPAIYESARRFLNGTAKVKIDGVWKSINKSGEIVY